MILIVSDEIDQSTNDVMDWLIKMNQPYIRANTSSFLSAVSIAFGNSGLRMSFQCEGMESPADLSQITAVWFRKGDLSINFNRFLQDLPLPLKKQVFEHLYDEWMCIKNFLFELFEKKKLLGNYFEAVPSKLSYLLIAQQCGLRIPETYIFNSAEQLERIRSEHPALITKSISDIFNAVYEDRSLFTYTEEVAKTETFPESFFPSMVQEKIPKKYELRVFFLNEALYAAALFSQVCEATKLDFRNSRDNTVRIVPYDLPDGLKTKLLHFIKETKLSTGSVDLLVTPANEVVFLEVNPSGQFGFVSANCNYAIEKQIAEYIRS
jgi:ATP-GRASP peptide maturase of grasp-with-spasm system